MEEARLKKTLDDLIHIQPPDAVMDDWLNMTISPPATTDSSDEEDSEDTFDKTSKSSVDYNEMFEVSDDFIEYSETLSEDSEEISDDTSVDTEDSSEEISWYGDELFSEDETPQNFKKGTRFDTFPPNRLPAHFPKQIMIRIRPIAPGVTLVSFHKFVRKNHKNQFLGLLGPT